MDVKRRTVALAVAVLLAALVGPSTSAFAADNEPSLAGLMRHEAPPGDGEQSGDNAEDPDDNGNRGETGRDGDSTDERREHRDAGDDASRHGDEGHCTSASGVTVCSDQPGADQPGH